MKHHTWASFFSEQFALPYGQALLAAIQERAKTQVIFPPEHQRFRAFELCPLAEVKVVIIGQDPYHQTGQANGLAFSVNEGIPLPPSLKNIYREIADDCQVTMHGQSGDLTYLATQGVLLLNAALTVEEGRPLAHQKLGYELLFQALLTMLNQLDKPLVFLLWGGHAKAYQRWLTHPHHLVLTANHPSPLSANRGGWFGCRHFSKTNAWLHEHGLTPVQWHRPIR